MIIYQVRLHTGEIRNCSFSSEEEMYATIEFEGEEVVEYWSREAS